MYHVKAYKTIRRLKQELDFFFLYIKYSCMHSSIEYVRRLIYSILLSYLFFLSFGDVHKKAFAQAPIDEFLFVFVYTEQLICVFIIHCFRLHHYYTYTYIYLSIYLSVEITSSYNNTSCLCFLL